MWDRVIGFFYEIGATIGLFQPPLMTEGSNGGLGSLGPSEQVGWSPTFLNGESKILHAQNIKENNQTSH